MSDARPRLLIFIPAFEAARYIEWVIDRIPRNLDERFQPHVLIIDDASRDATPTIASRALERSGLSYPFDVFVNPRNRGYGGNQKLGYEFAVANGFDVVVMLHGDGQYPPELIGDLATTALEHGAAFGSRFSIKGGALRGGMPKYKWLGNRVLTSVQNRLLETNLTEFHSGFRAYTTDALRKVPFGLNSNDFHFDTEIFIQMKRAGIDIGEFGIPTHYGDEVSRVNGLSYARNVITETVKARIHDMGLFYEMKFDVAEPTEHYESKLDFDSPSTRVAASIVPKTTVLDLGSSTGHLAGLLGDQGCRVIGVDVAEPVDTSAFSVFITHDLNAGMPAVDSRVDVVLLLDVVEHLMRPEGFVRSLAEFCERRGVSQVFVSTGNVAFVLQRLALLGGQFNYGPRGILDMTHTRLFTFRTIKRLFRQAGFVVERAEGVPAPFPLAVGSKRSADLLLAVNRALIRLLPRMFSYQILLRLRPPEPLERLINESVAHGATVVREQRHDGDLIPRTTLSTD